VKNVPDDPVIQNCESTGYPDRCEPGYPHCPKCGRIAYRIYKDAKTGEVLGCDVCVDDVDAFEVPECFPEGKE